jgi:hypothetical protein
MNPKIVSRIMIVGISILLTALLVIGVVNAM